MNVFYYGFSFNESIDFYKKYDYINRFEKMEEENYIYKNLEYGTPYGTLSNEKDDIDLESMPFNLRKI